MRFHRIDVVRVAVIAGLAALAVPTTVHAADLIIPLDTTIVSGVTEGEQVQLAVVASDGLAGQRCAVRSLHGGTGAVHPGNDLIVRSGNRTARLVDVERAAAAITDGTVTITLGQVIEIDLVVGPDEEFGGDLELELECAGAPTPTSARTPAPTPTSARTPAPAPAPAQTPVPTSAPAPTSTSGPSALPVTGPRSTATGLLLGSLLVLAGYGLTVLARPPERS